MGVIKSIYPGGIICAEPDIGSEMLRGFRGFPLQYGCHGVIPKLYLHDAWCLWYHCNTKEHKKACTQRAVIIQHDELPARPNNSKTKNKTVTNSSMTQKFSKSLLQQMSKL